MFLSNERTDGQKWFPHNSWYHSQEKDVKTVSSKFQYRLCCLSVILQPYDSHSATLFFVSPRVALVLSLRPLVYGLCVIKTTLELNRFSAKIWVSGQIKRTSALFTLKLYKNKNIRCSFKVTADATDKDKQYGICSMPDRVIRDNFCDGLEMKFTSPLGEIQHAGAPETPAKSVAACFTFS